MKINRFDLVEVDEILLKILARSKEPNITKLANQALEILADLFDTNE